MFSVKIPNHERRYQLVKKSRKSGNPRYWTINGQGLYNATLHYRARGKITKYFHKYLSKYILEQITKADIKLLRKLVYKDSTHKLSISLDIYEQRLPKIPDIGNMWLWTKWFEDALQETGVIPDDNPDYVIESGRKRYHWVDNESDRKLIFNIEIV
jgi:Holliday junction resolvase RusA-like endonuclease